MPDDVKVMEVRVVRIRPGDVLVYSSPEPLPPEEADRLLDHLHNVFPGYPAVILDDGGELEVARSETAQAGAALAFAEREAAFRAGALAMRARAEALASGWGCAFSPGRLQADLDRALDEVCAAAENSL